MGWRCIQVGLFVMRRLPVEGTQSNLTPHGMLVVTLFLSIIVLCCFYTCFLPLDWCISLYFCFLCWMWGVVYKFFTMKYFNIPSLPHVCWYDQHKIRWSKCRPIWDCKDPSVVPSCLLDRLRLRKQLSRASLNHLQIDTCQPMLNLILLSLLSEAASNIVHLLQCLKCKWWFLLLCFQSTQSFI